MSNLLDFFQEFARNGKMPRDKSALTEFLQNWANNENNYYSGPADIIPNDPINTPIQAPTINNAPPVGQTGNVEPAPFFKYQPPAGQTGAAWNPRNPDPRITIDEAPPVSREYTDNNYLELSPEQINFIVNSAEDFRKRLQEQGYRPY